MYSTKFKITNLDCEACVKTSTMALESIDGVTGVKIDFKSGDSELTADREISWDKIIEALKTVNKKATNNT